MSSLDRSAPLRYLRTAFAPDDWVAIFLKSYDTGRVSQRVGPVRMFCEPRWQTWLRAMNSPYRFNVYLSVNAIAAGRRARTKDAIGSVRHVFIEADHGGPEVLAAVAARRDLPPPSYVMHSSPNRVHVLWRAHGFTTETVERLQRHLASELGTDPAATPCTQTTRLPGFLNTKYADGHLVTIDYFDVSTGYCPKEFPLPSDESNAPRCRLLVTVVQEQSENLERARRYLERVPPAIAGQHGDLHTFQVCCRLVRGFALSRADALALLLDWNTRCEPPWTERELRDKLRRACKYGREPMGGMLEKRRIRCGSIR
jgi:hypothetical protein